MTTSPLERTSSPPSPVAQENGARLYTMKLRVYPTLTQTRKGSDWLWVTHTFRNEAVAFLKARQQEAYEWLKVQAVKEKSARLPLPAHLKSSALKACSAWLTERLHTARQEAQQVGLTFTRYTQQEVVRAYWNALDREARETSRDLYLLTLPRTALDQVILDLKKTTSKAIKDRVQARATGKKARVVGFPQFQRWSYAGSCRLQVHVSRNTSFREAWAEGKLFLPELGLLPFRDKGYTLPPTPPSLITLSRNAKGEWYVTFVCVCLEYLELTRNKKHKKHKKTVLASALGASTTPTAEAVAFERWGTLPRDPETGFPTIEGIDVGLTDLVISTTDHESGRIRYLKRYEKRLARGQRLLAKKKRGSRRWKQMKKALATTHGQVASLREVMLKALAHMIATRSAIVCLETLNLAFMLKNKRLAASAHDAALGKLMRLIEEACQKRGHLVLRAGRFEPTTQRCPGCKTINSALKNALHLRKWTCASCKKTWLRDRASSLNVLEAALREAAQLLGKTGVENISGMCAGSLIHPDLRAWIVRGGFTSALEHYRAKVSGIMQEGQRSEAVEAYALTQPGVPCLEQGTPDERGILETAVLQPKIEASLNDFTSFFCNHFVVS